MHRQEFGSDVKRRQDEEARTRLQLNSGVVGLLGLFLSLTYQSWTAKVQIYERMFEINLGNAHTPVKNSINRLFSENPILRARLKMIIKCTKCLWLEFRIMKITIEHILILKQRVNIISM